MSKALTVLNPIDNNEFEITTNIGSWTYSPVDKVFTWNNQFKDVIDLDSTNDILAKALEQMFIPSDVLELKKSFAQCFIDQESFTKVCTLKTKSNKHIRVVLTALPIVKDDVLEQIIGSLHPEKADPRREISLTDYQVMLDSFAIIAQTDPRGRIVCCNQNFCKISSYHKEELLGSDHRIVNSGHHPKSFFQDLWQTIRSGRTWTGEICNMNRYGDIYWVHTYITPLIRDGEIQAYMSLRFDITEKKLLAKQIERQNEEKAHFNAHLATLAELSVSIAHEINNPLTVIDAMSGFIKQENKENTNIKKAVDKIHKAVVRITKITNLFKNFSRNTVYDDFLDADVKDIVQETIDFCQATLTKNGIELKSQKIPEELILYCREIEISQAILNLIHNAKDSIEDLDEKWIEIKVIDHKEYISIHVIDSGKGIPQELQEKIMQSFYTTKSVGKGTGLGLSIVKRFVDNHSGELYIDNTNPNTAFVMKLPKEIKR